MSEKKFASQADLVEKTVSFDKLSEHAKIGRAHV